MLSLRKIDKILKILLECDFLMATSVIIKK